MTTDYFAELKKQPYPLYVAPKRYSFDLNEDMIKMLRNEFNAETVSGELMAAIKVKSQTDAPKAAAAFFKEMNKQIRERVKINFQ